MSNLAVCVMAYNEAECLERCLESVQGWGELHVSIDRATTDDSEAVARRYTGNVYSHLGLPAVAPEQDHPEAAKAVNSYARMRNEFLNQVAERSRAEWFVWLDADEVLLEGGEVLLNALPQIPAEAEAIAVRMNLYREGRLESVMRNSKVIRRQIRFTRRRHEHIVFNGQQVMCDPCVLGHFPTQPQEARAAHDQRKLQLEAFLADWAEFQDGRSAFYTANWWHTVGHEEEALCWCERALHLPDTKCGGGQRGHVARYAGRLSMELGRWNEARQFLFEAMRADWQDAESVYYLGHIAAAHRQFEEARHWFAVALTYPEMPESVMQQDIHATRALPYYGLACVARAEGNRAEAYHYLDLCERAFGGVEHPQVRELRDKLDRE